MRNTESESRQMMLSTVLVITLITVVVNGGSTLSVLSYLKIEYVHSKHYNLTLEHFEMEMVNA